MPFLTGEAKSIMSQTNENWFHTVPDMYGSRDYRNSKLTSLEKPKSKWMLHHDKTPPHRYLLGSVYLSEHHIVVLTRPASSPWMKN
ncbi:hypothetical protein AVEN_256345-1 [Araneus ventricosus]|uniref:Uncharacterized protein n=1 Tax=Araneus ventricosus TaxID=182803 RepID=A0A4Y2VQH2_ARAVE|nr:hypothetical protein AVEN_256345-1 [Araneus ventricosus]